jgi:hypothetical protein
MLYYLAIAAIGYISYKKWENEVNIVVIKGVFEATKLYHKLNDYFGNQTNLDVVEDDIVIKKELLEIKEGKGYPITLNIGKEEFLNKIKDSILLLSINNKKKVLKDEDYHEINKLENINLIDNKLFLQIIITNEKDEKEIHESMKKYMVIGNEILEYNFLKWFMDFTYNVKLKDDYKITIMDNNIKLFTITKKQSISILDDSTYELINK